MSTSAIAVPSAASSPVTSAVQTGASSVAVPSGVSQVATSALIQPSSGATNGTSGGSVGPSGLTVQSQTPIFACVPASYNYTGGSPPYLLFIIRSNTNNANVLKTLPAAASPGTASWGVDIQPGTPITFVVQDSLNRTEYSAPLVVQTNSDLSCLPSQSSGTSAGAIAGGVVGGVAGAAIILAAIWFFIIRPARRGDKRAKSESYGETRERQLGSTGGASSVHKPHSETTGPAGSYNLQSLDFNESSLMALQEQRPAPPAYHDPHANPRSARRTREAVASGEDTISYEARSRNSPPV